MSENTSPDFKINQLLKELALVKERNKSLEQENERYRQIVESGRDLVSIHDEQARFIYASPASLSILGYQPDELAGKDAYDLIHEDDIDMVRKNQEACLENSGENKRVVYRMKRKDGTWIWMETLAKTFSPDGHKTYLVANTRDVTEPIRLRHDLENSHQRYKSLVENLPFILLRYDANFDLTYASPNVSGLFPFTDSDIKGKKPANLGFSESETHRLENSIKKVMTGKHPAQLDVEMQTAHGPRSLEWKFVPEFNNRHHSLSVLAIVKDNTESQVTLQALHKALEIQAATEKLSRSGTFTVNFGTGEIYWSNGLYELTDRTKNEGPVNEVELQKIMSGKEYEKFINMLQKARHSRHPIRGEFKVVLKKKPLMFIEVEIHRDLFSRADDPKIIGIVRDKTDLQRIQISLSSSEEKFRNIFKTVPDGIVVSSFENGMMVDFNSAFLELTRYKAEDVRNHTSVELKLFPDTETRRNFFSDISKGRSMVNKELSLRDKFGEILDVLVSSTIISIDGENFMLSVIRDVSDIKRVEREVKKSNARLLASEEKFTTFLKHSPDGIMMTDEQGFIQEWNISMESLTGIRQDEAKGSYIVDILGRIYNLSLGEIPDLVALENRLRTFFETGDKKLISLKESLEIEIPGSGKRYIENYSFPIKSDKGYRIGQITRDITEEKVFENNVLLYRDIFMNIEDGVAILDLECKYMQFNPAHQQLLGYNDEELFGKSPATFLGQKLFDEIFKVYDYQKAFEGELIAKKKNGKDIYLDFILFPVLSNDNPVCIISVIRDISERKKSEKELIEARRVAEEADALKTAFLSNMSHEIRTPMNSIIGFSGLLEKPGLSEEKRNKYVSYINKNGANLLHLIDDIIDISKIESNQVKMEKSGVNVREMVEDLYISMTRVLKKEGKTSLHLNMNIPDQELWIYTDGYRLRQVLVNLVHNAIKFTEKGNVEIGYHAGKENELLFHVKDTGIGIPPELKDTIFERFRKLENVKKKIYGGAGLGLAISKQLINLLGGKIWVESYVGKGTAFYFTIPLVLSEKVWQGAGETEGINSRHHWEGKKVLIVEDDQFSYELLSEFLEETGVEYHHVYDGRSAVNFMTDNGDINLVVMDIQVPGMNGYEATRLIKTIKPDIPVIAQTAFAMDEDRQTALSSGCDAFLTKPVDRQQFLELLDNYLGHNDTPA